MNWIEVTIMGQGYRLVCPEDGEAPLLAAAAAVDREMSAIRDAGKVKARERIAVLAALNLAYQLADSTPRKAPAAAQEPGTAADAAQLEALIRRVDAALNDDGQLL